MHLTIDNTLTEEETIIIYWQLELLGGFYTTLMKAITLADTEHLDKLALSFPVHVNAYKRFSTESGWWQTVTTKYKNLTGREIF